MRGGEKAAVGSWQLAVNWLLPARLRHSGGVACYWLLEQFSVQSLKFKVQSLKIRVPGLAAGDWQRFQTFSFLITYSLFLI
jgi:hypothetical protein